MFFLLLPLVETVFEKNDYHISPPSAIIVSPGYILSRSIKRICFKWEIPPLDHFREGLELSFLQKICLRAKPRKLPVRFDSSRFLVVSVPVPPLWGNFKPSRNCLNDGIRRFPRKKNDPLDEI